MGRFIKPPKRITTFFLEHGPAHGLKFELIDVDGSENSLAQIDHHQLDLAVVKGGIRLDKDIKNVRQITTLDMEAFHLLVNEKIFQAWKDDWEHNFNLLKDRRININKKGTGTYLWSLNILKFAGLTPQSPDGKGNFTPVLLGNPELVQAVDDIKNAANDEQRRRLIADLPDAILFADLVPSTIVHGLVDQAHYRLVPLDFGPAYLQDLHAAPDDSLDPTAMIEVVTIPAFSYGVGPHSVPRHSCATLGVRRLLVANKDVPIQAVIRCLQMLYDDGPNTSLDFLEWSKFRPQYKLHDGVQVYDDERRQVLQNTIVKFMEKLASVLGGIIGGILAIYGYFRWRRLLRFEHYFHEIRRIELIARGVETDPAAPTTRPELLIYLRNQLSDLRSAAIVEFARGRLQGENLILSIFTLVKDTSQYLNMVLGEKGK
jgi:hypothetical protein